MNSTGQARQKDVRRLGRFNPRRHSGAVAKAGAHQSQHNVRFGGTVIGLGSPQPSVSGDSRVATNYAFFASPTSGSGSGAPQEPRQAFLPQIHLRGSEVAATSGEHSDRADRYAPQMGSLVGEKRGVPFD